ncbi:MAG: TfuA-like protein [Arenicellales bacterium]
MLRLFQKPYVFGGPSLELLTTLMREQINERPPVRNGDLQTLCSDVRPGTALILDGLFGSELAINPTEIRQAMEAGWQVYGAASMGAMRAAELWPLGMIGLGDVYNLLRSGCLSSDADMAVLYVSTHFREATISMVHIQFLLNHMHRCHHLPTLQARKMKLAAQHIYWTERTLGQVLAAWHSIAIEEQHINIFSQLVGDPSLHPKKRDGYYATAILLAQQWVDVYDLHSDAKNKDDTAGDRCS